MTKILALDYGEKRTGVAITDDRQIMAFPLDTVDTKKISAYLTELFLREAIETIVVGEAKYLNGQESAITIKQQDFVKMLGRQFPEKNIERVNEMFTSAMAGQVLLMSGMKKKDRQQKGNLDKVSAAIILQSYLQMRG